MMTFLLFMRSVTSLQLTILRPVRNSTGALSPEAWWKTNGTGQIMSRSDKNLLTDSVQQEADDDDATQCECSQPVDGIPTETGIADLIQIIQSRILLCPGDANKHCDREDRPDHESSYR